MDWPTLADTVLLHAMDRFGVPFTHTPAAGGDPQDATGVFDAARELLELQFETGIPHSTVHPVLAVRLVDLTVAPHQGDEIVVAGGTYTIADVRPDGHGGASLVLVK